MTRDEFMDNINDFSELLEFCSDEDCEICADIYRDDDYDREVEDDIANAGYGWRALRDYLSDLPTGYDYYRRNGSFDYDGLDDRDFEDYKSEVAAWMDDGGWWDEDEPEDDWEPEEEPFEEEEPDDPDSFDADDVDFVQVFVEASESFAAVATANARQLAQERQDIEESLERCLFDVTHL